ncbi:hypothetical protein ACSNOI_28865 [Actinomadura kijaniata]|uniref:hypothetical protein n=1 Tax=Actinomadura kijaniata TaxID=46161 RepID=UPI003F193945
MAEGREVAAAERAVRRWNSCGTAWLALLRHVWSAGEAGMDEGGPIIEGPPVLFEVNALSWDDPVLCHHGDRIRMARAARESSQPRDLVRRAEPGEAPVGYSVRLRDLQGVDQIRWVTDLLRARPWTTSAWISLTVPGEPVDAVPCLAALSFRIRGYQLIMTAMFRSQNAYRAYLSYIPLRGVQLAVAEGLGLPVGPMRIFVDVPYVAVTDAERVAAILTASPAPEPNAA